MIDIHSKHENMHMSGMFDAIFCINNNINIFIDSMLSKTPRRNHRIKITQFLLVFVQNFKSEITRENQSRRERK